MGVPPPSDPVNLLHLRIAFGKYLGIMDQLPMTIHLLKTVLVLGIRGSMPTML